MRDTPLESCYGSPAVAAWQDRLAVAWVDPGSSRIKFALGRVPLGTGPGEEFAPAFFAATGLVSPGGHVALISYIGGLYLAWVDASSNLFVAPFDDAGFGQPVYIAGNVAGGVSGAANHRLHLAWRAPGNQVTTVHTYQGEDAFAPARPLGHASASDPGIAAFVHPFYEETSFLSVADPAVRLVEGDGPGAFLPAPGKETGVVASGQVALLRAGAGDRDEFVLLYRRDGRVAFRRATRDLEFYGEEHIGPASSYEPAATGWGDDLIVAYVTPAGQLRVGSWGSVFAMPPELAARVGQPCDPRKCSDDPRLVCVLSGVPVVEQQPARISNALAGHLVLTPGDGDGAIGTILKALQPPEFYDHMGLMTEDYEEIRHCTESKERLMKDKSLFTGKLFGNPAPTDGLRPDLVAYGWPGPITQSIQNGFFDGWNDGANPDLNYHRLAAAGASGGLAGLGEDQRRAFFDRERPETSRKITNLSLAPTYRSDHPGPLRAIVVRPPRGAEQSLPWVRWLLDRVVKEARGISGHYRFYAYSKAQIALEPRHFAPPKLDPSWRQLPAGADWAAGTPGIVCSTFVWLAALRATSGLRPGFRIDDDRLHPEDGRRREAGGGRADGLYVYFAPERYSAAESLHGWIVAMVEAELKKEIDGIWIPLTVIGVDALVGIITGAVATPAVGAVAAAMTAAALSSIDADLLARTLTQVPNKVANGVVNAFANDEPENVEYNAWTEPHEGLSVSPDDIWKYWDAPAEIDDGGRAGLWGTAEPAMLANPRPELVERGTLQPSPGVCRLSGDVRYKGQLLDGAEVSVGCRRATTEIEGGFHIDVPANGPGEKQSIYAQAYRDGVMLRKRLSATLPPGRASVGAIELEMPPPWRRRVEVHGEVVMAHRVLIGHDSIRHLRVSDSYFLQADPGVIALDPKGAGLAASRRDFGYETDVCGGEKAHLFGTVRVLDRALDVLPGVRPRPPGASDLSVVVEWTFEILDGDDHVAVRRGTLVVPPDQSRQLTLSIHDTEIPADLASCDLTIENNVNPA